MVDVDLSIVFAGLSIAASIVYYASVLRNANKTQQMQLETRKVQLFMQLYQQLTSEETLKASMELMTLDIKDNDEYLKKYDSSVNPAHYAKRAHIWWLYNSIGELLRMGTIEHDLIDRLQLDVSVIVTWEKWEHIIKETRARENLPNIWGGFEYLYSETKKIRDMRGYPDIRLTQPDNSS
jgi:hypothetical protein